MINSAISSRVTQLNPGADVSPTSLQLVARKIKVKATQPMFIHATILAPIVFQLKQIDSDFTKVKEREDTKKIENNLPNTMLPCRQVMADLLTVHNSLRGFKAKGLLLGKSANIKEVGYIPIPNGANIDFKAQ